MDEFVPVLSPCPQIPSHHPPLTQNPPDNLIFPPVRVPWAKIPDFFAAFLLVLLSLPPLGCV